MNKKLRFVIVNPTTVALIIAINLLSIVGSADNGTLVIKSEPSEANVYIDDIYKGVTPITVDYISTGDHTIKITKTGYYDWINTIKVSIGQININAPMEIMECNLEIYTEIGLGRVYIDGAYAGIAGWDAPLSRYLPCGSHEIHIEWEGCNDWTQTVLVQKQTTKVVSTFKCNASANLRKSAEISFLFGGPSSSYSGSTLNVDVIVTNTGFNFNNTFPIVVSLSDPYGNWTVLPYQYVTLNDDEKIHVIFDYNIPITGPAGIWTAKAEVWDRIAEGGILQTRYDYKEKKFNVSIGTLNESIQSTPTPEPILIVDVPTGKLVHTKVINSKFGQPDLEITAGDEVMWDNNDPISYRIVEIDKKIGDINLRDNEKAKYIFNTTGNYRLRLYYTYMEGVIPVIQTIRVIPPISTSKASPSVTPTLTITQMTTATPTSTPLTEQEVKEISERLNKTEDGQGINESGISWLRSTINSIIDWFKSVF